MKMNNLGSKMIFLVMLTLKLSLASEPIDTREMNILVFGGNGFLASETVSLLLDQGHQRITIVNRGGKYWDAAERVFARVQKSLKCDRSSEAALAGACPELADDVGESDRYDFVLDFTALTQRQLNDTLDLLKDKVGVYVLVSTDQVYDVCDTGHGQNMVQESQARRPSSTSDRIFLTNNFKAANERFKVEEELMRRQKEGEGHDYVILRLADAFGPRDTSYRWWLYQIWLSLSERLTAHPIHMPAFLEAYRLSFVYAPDVAATLARLLPIARLGGVLNEPFNLAYPKPFTLMQVLDEMKASLGLEQVEVSIIDTLEHQDHFYSYPSTRSGPLNVTKAVSTLHFRPTDWRQAVKDTVAFFDGAMRGADFVAQRNEVVQVAGARLFAEMLPEYYEALEQLYDIDLAHFRLPKDEL